MPLTPARTLRIPSRYAMSFDGVDDYVRVANSPSFNPSQGTWMFWAMLRESRGRYKGIIGKYGFDSSVGTYTGWDFYVPPWNTNVFRFRHTQNIYIEDPKPIFNAWSCYTLVNNGTHSWLYRNNVLIAEKDMLFPSPSPHHVHIGTRQPGDLQGDHTIAEVLFYNRVLSAGEISWNFNNFSNPVRDGLVLSFIAHPDYIRDIDNDGILEWIDLSGFNNHGKIFGATLVDLFKTPVRTLPAVRTLPVAR
jgi:hypothetical protein